MTDQTQKERADRFEQRLREELKKQSGKSQKDASATVGRAVNKALLSCFCELPPRSTGGKRAAYFSAEFLPGSITTQSLAALELAEVCDTVLKEAGFRFELLERPRDPALGNGGLGRLAACLLDAAAATDLPLDGYGIRYRYGIFRQSLHHHAQTESPDLWQQAFALEKECRAETETVCFGDGAVLAVPFDIPIVGKKRLNRLRLWQCEPLTPVDFSAFSKGELCSAFAEQNKAAAVSAFLYPPDETDEGKALRLKQQYFFTAASLGSILSEHKKAGKPIRELAESIQIQLNDTHPTVAIPELLRRLIEDYGLPFSEAFSLVGHIFAYTNHTVMAEALECWDEGLFCRVLPKVYPYVVMIHNHLRQSLAEQAPGNRLAILQNGRLHMADLAVFCSHKVNGVARIHSEIIKESVFREWNDRYPERFLNITNGISHRRWLCLANRELSDFADARIGTDWREDLTRLEELRSFDSAADLSELADIKRQKKLQLAAYAKTEWDLKLDPDFIFSVQVKRIHEYKRQLLNILAVLGLYLDLKSGLLTDLHPTLFLFAGKAAPGYYLAKEIIRLIGAVSDLLQKDETARKYLQVAFLPDYSVKNAMKIIPAADLSEQLSTAGTEASGTGNMKLSLNGAPTIGTMDGATIEIVDRAGAENNYIFGATKEEIQSLYDYDPMNIYYTNDRISRVVDLLKDGPAGDFTPLFRALLFGDAYTPADRYHVLMDYPSYFEARLRANADYKDHAAYTRKGLAGIAAAAHFSADATIQNYNQKIWHL